MYGQYTCQNCKRSDRHARYNGGQIAPADRQAGAFDPCKQRRAWRVCAKYWQGAQYKAHLFYTAFTGRPAKQAKLSGCAF